MDVLLVFILHGFRNFQVNATDPDTLSESIMNFSRSLSFLANSPLIMSGIEQCVERGYINRDPPTIRVTNLGMEMVRTYAVAHGPGFGWDDEHYQGQLLKEYLLHHETEAIGDVLDEDDAIF